MPATEAQVRANQANAARSTGPKTEAGKARSRLNATTHGMAGELPEVGAVRSDEFEGRRATWSAEYHPVGEMARWAMDRAVAASLRIERCERALDDLTEAARTRALLAWEEDRAVDASLIADRLGREPSVASRQLETTLAGVSLKIEAWSSLLGALQEGREWTEEEGSRALDLLGVPTDQRSGRSTIDGPEGSDLADFRQFLAIDELERLEKLRAEAMIPLDAMERRQAMAGHVALLSKPAKLVLRYERDAWNRYRRSIREVTDPSATADVPERRAVAVVDRPVVKSSEPAPIRREVATPSALMGSAEEGERLDELERRIEANLGSMGQVSTDRTQSVGSGTSRLRR